MACTHYVQKGSAIWKRLNGYNQTNGLPNMSGDKDTSRLPSCALLPAQEGITVGLPLREL